MTSSSQKKLDYGIIEAILFVSPRPVSEDRLAQLLNLDREALRKEMSKFMRRFNKTHQGIKIVKNRKHYYITVKDDYLEIVSKLMEPPPLNNRQKLIVAYLYQKKIVPLRELKNVFGPAIYRDVKKLRRWGFISITSRDGIKHAVMRPEAEAYIIKKKNT